MLEVSETILKQRLENRKGHFFSPKLLSSQLSSMESLNRLELDDGATLINNDLDDYEQMLQKVIEAIDNT
jgi:gluconate kinase